VRGSEKTLFYKIYTRKKTKKKQNKAKKTTKQKKAQGRAKQALKYYYAIFILLEKALN